MKPQKKILMIIDDDPQDRFFFKNALEEIEASYEWREASSGPDGLEQLRNAEILPDFIFLDLNMPMMNGLECLAELKGDKRLKGIPVIIYSTSNYYKDIELTKTLGVAAFLTKTSDLKTLPHDIIRAMKEAEAETGK